MKFGVNDVCLEHDPGERHPENPDRIRAIKRGLQKRHGVEYVTGDPASEDDARAVHEDEYVAEIRDFCADGGGSWDPDTVAVEATWRAALASAGLSMWAADAALDGADGRSTPFALGRPPGHHAVADDAMGFCFVNNAAVASQHALDSYDAVERVAIFDWDVHHGNGTQDIFYERGDVFYASIHEAGLYPGTGDIEEVGEGDGEGSTLNAPLPAGAGDVDYCHVLDDVLSPAIEAFDPDLLLVSAGFDAHRHDPISRMHVSTDGYGTLTTRVRDLAAACDAGLGFVLEGGYSLDTLSEGVGMVHEVFDGFEPEGPDEDAEPSEDVREVVAELRDRHGLGSK
ncbi:histone deacetylase [Halarchaeum sp. CBA1220]|uniref:histone deacetylase family protein n=1 Tax=Halarchaeum sp. CBA1220 TaxID=1853682 RepID=UPI000F3A8268|nr:histone deacetylase [Halarchaeum sp. CBA1220]QLC33631.1 histone deacetylase [Halarchaeum sp. CBA1220]